MSATVSSPTISPIMLSDPERSRLQASCARSTCHDTGPDSTSNNSLVSSRGERFGRYCLWIERARKERRGSI